MLGTKLSVALPWASERKVRQQEPSDERREREAREYLEKHLILKLLNHPAWPSSRNLLKWHERDL